MAKVLWEVRGTPPRAIKEIGDTVEAGREAQRKTSEILADTADRMIRSHERARQYDHQATYVYLFRGVLWCIVGAALLFSLLTASTAPSYRFLAVLGVVVAIYSVISNIYLWRKQRDIARTSNNALEQARGQQLR
jgi:hypothetical protein